MDVSEGPITSLVHRSLARVIQLAPPARGQFGPQHTVVEVLRPEAWAEQDPFILLMDDRIDGLALAGPHPHAGFETVTFPLEGGMESEGGAGRLRPGDVEWTTAGSGIVHGPERPIEGHFRILQLWLTLPKQDRWTTPDNQIVAGDTVPIRREAGVEIRLYSGSTGALTSPTRNRVPVTLLDVRLEPGARVEQTLPASYNGFLYVLDGEARVGADHAALRPTQVGWLDSPAVTGDSVVTLANEGSEPMRLLFYAGERQGVPIVSYGPFIGDTREDIVRSFEQYRAGTFRRV
ncbi:MAG: pirin family protein [Myxococcales bacterium]|nr:pirin family protein [Myxococcales bacterium]